MEFRKKKGQGGKVGEPQTNKNLWSNKHLPVTEENYNTHTCNTF